MNQRHELTGVILAGGHGTRMGRVEKGLMQIHNEPQYLFLYKLLQKISHKVVLSIREEQQTLYGLPYGMSVIIDEYKDIGPMGGILSCLKRLKSAVLVLSCDLYQIETDSLETLNTERDSNLSGTIYFDEVNGFLQPLCAIYEPNSVLIMEDAVISGDYSMHRLIRRNKFKILNTSQSQWFENQNYKR